VGGKGKLALCVVDDDPDELARFEKFLKKDFDVGSGSSVDDAQRDLKRKHKRQPDLFVLDMYFPTKVNSDADRAALDQKWEEFSAAEQKFKTALLQMGQSLKGGRTLARRVKLLGKRFVFFTRKGNLSDAIEAYEHTGALSVIRKPDPPLSAGAPRSKKETEKARDEAMKELANNVRDEIKSAVERAVPALSKKAFIAMWYNKEVGRAYERGIVPAVRAFGYKPLLIKNKEHINKIDAEIIAEIDRSAFLIADFTGHRGGVYFEAGYAIGRGLPVIFTCRKDQMKKLHFDIRQYNCIDWETPNELKKRLRKRVGKVLKGP
jgi:hypothetical protein